VCQSLAGYTTPTFGTGTDDYALVRGFRAESGRAGGDSGTRGLAWACEELWKRLKRDERFAFTEVSRFSDHVWGKRWREIAIIGGASGGTARLWPYLTEGGARNGGPSSS
jgi:hypothetical protein